MHDFVRHVSLFELLPYSLYEWTSDNASDACATQVVNSQLVSFQGQNILTESQRFETSITQQWLRMSMWRSGLESGSTPRQCSLPVDVGMVVMRNLCDVEQKSKDCLGIGLVRTTPLSPSHNHTQPTTNIPRNKNCSILAWA